MTKGGVFGESETFNIFSKIVDGWGVVVGGEVDIYTHFQLNLQLNPIHSRW